MARPNHSAERLEDIQVAVAGLSITETIELNAQNRFSGCLTVEYGGSQGMVFFRDGEIIHAEQSGKSGPDAFCDILEWRATRFSTEANMATTRRTIQMPTAALMAEARRVVDERRATGGMSATRVQTGAEATPRDNAAALLARLRAIPGVAYVVLTSKDGTCLSDGSIDGETLAGRTAYLAMIANHLGTIFRAGPVQSAVVQGQDQHLLLLAGKSHNLSVLVRANAQVRVVEAEVRKVLTAKG